LGAKEHIKDPIFFCWTQGNRLMTKSGADTDSSAMEVYFSNDIDFSDNVINIIGNWRKSGWKRM
jgi:hypothetical protein